MDNQQAIQLFFEILRSKLWSMIFGLLLLAVAVQLGRQASRNVAGYILFRIDKHLSLGRRIRLFDGRSGDIKDYSFSGVTIETEDTLKTIPWDEWRGSYELYRTDVKNRRSTDSCKK